ncbi:PREDICTED: nodulin homeobox isoform X2 [Ipomoea nil]|uniref:nodulin homeobox isoform X2 n=1 Tax=Ipomoea nil TaxID=35883 RepID=UPI000900AE95|nr:PREDICTED: nodulin homeobox isoform X2 [Ipomoea nil]
MRLSKEEATCSAEPASTSVRRAEPPLDLVSAVKGLHTLGSQELSRLIRDAENNILRHSTQNGSSVQVDLEKLARHLSLHLIAVIMARETNEALLKYLLSGFQLLHSLSDIASRHPKLEQILLDDIKVSEQLLDLVFYSLIILCTYCQKFQVSNDMVLLHSTLVASSLYILTVCISSQWHELAQVFLAYYKVDIFMDAAFAALCADMKFLQSRLSVEHPDSFADSTSKAVEILNHLCQQCEASLQFIQSLCQQKVFRERLLKNKELCSNGGVLLLAQAVMNLNISPLFLESSSIVAAVSRLKSKVLSILLNLCEAESVSYLDEVASTPASLDLAKSIALKVLELLKNMFERNPKQSCVLSDKSYPRGQLQLNAMRLADIFSDDSNFRSYITTHFTEVLTAIFSPPHGEFLSSWCSPDLPVREEDATLEYDPFAAAGWLFNFYSSYQLIGASSESTFIPSNVSRVPYGHQRTSLLVKIIANLHCFVPDICKDDKDLFLKKFHECLQNEPTKSAVDISSVCYAEKVAVIRRNLGSLLSHAESLIPTFLNEEDVQLLRVFITQLESLIAPAEIGENRVQEAQSAVGCSLSQLRNGDPPDLTNKSGDIREDILDISSHQEVDQLEISGSGSCRPANVESSSVKKARSIPSEAKVIVEIEKEAQNLETNESDSSSKRGKNPNNQVDNVEHIKGGWLGEVRDDEMVESAQHEERPQRKRKRTIMNDKQITIIEKALIVEPEMQRNKASLEFWADELSVHGSEVSRSQLKNWLNNRKAKLARAVKDGCMSSEGDNPDKHGERGNAQNTIEDPTVRAAANGNPGTLIESSKCQPGQYVVLVNDKKEEIGRGKVFQVSGKWFGKDVGELGTCVVDIIELKVERLSWVPYPSEVTGTSFEQAERKFGFMRVLWDSTKLFVLPR